MSTLPIAYMPGEKNFLELYRRHRDEIDALADPTSLFILAFTNQIGRVTLDDLTKDVNLTRNALRTKLTPLLRGQLVGETQGVLIVTAYGKRVLAEIGFVVPPIPPTNQPEQPEPPQQPPQPPRPPVASAGTPGWLWGFIAFLGIGLILLLIFLRGGTSVSTGGASHTLAPATLASFLTAAPTFTPSPTPSAIGAPANTSTVSPVSNTIATDTPTPIAIISATPLVPPSATPSTTPTWTQTPTPSSTPTPSPTPSPSYTPSRTPTRTATRTFTPTPTRDTVGPPAPAIVAPKNNVKITCAEAILDWNPSSDPSGVKNYSVRLELITFLFGNTLYIPVKTWDPVTGTKVDASNSVQAGAAYRWNVFARDNAGNNGTVSPWAHFTTYNPCYTIE